MIILGFDPGKTIGWCIYDSAPQTVLQHGEIATDSAATIDVRSIVERFRQDTDFDGYIAIERPRAYGVAGSEIADACEQAGWIIAETGGAVVPVADLGNGAWHRGNACYLLERRAVVRQVHLHFGQQIKGDGPIWKALLDNHGGAEAMQGPRQGKAATRKSPAIPSRIAGHLGGMGGHARAAFATAWALARILEGAK